MHLINILVHWSILSIFIYTRKNTACFSSLLVCRIRICLMIYKEMRNSVSEKKTIIYRVDFTIPNYKITVNSCSSEKCRFSQCLFDAISEPFILIFYIVSRNYILLLLLFFPKKHYTRTHTHTGNWRTQKTPILFIYTIVQKLRIINKFPCFP